MKGCVGWQVEFQAMRDRENLKHPAPLLNSGPGASPWFGSARVEQALASAQPKPPPYSAASAFPARRPRGAFFAATTFVAALRLLASAGFFAAPPRRFKSFFFR